MNRALFITIGIVIILLTLGVWSFLLINGNPQSTEEIFSDLGIVPKIERQPIDVDITNTSLGSTDTVVLSLDGEKLQQITTEAVAGFKLATTSEGGNLLRYVELGTGHVFDVNLISGLKSQTFPNTTLNTVEAYISPDNSHVVLVANGIERQVTVLNIPEGGAEVRKISLPSDAENITFTTNNILNYTRNTAQNTTLYTYNLDTNEATTYSVVNIPDATVISSTPDTHFIYPKPTKYLTGALYKLSKKTLSAVSEPAFDLTAFISGDSVYVSYIANSLLQTYKTPYYIAQNIVMLRDKCTSDGGETVWCGAPSKAATADFMEDWYKGSINSDDTIWSIDTQTGITTELAVPKTLTGRQIDLIKPQVTADHTSLVFINKIDQTLWLLRL